MSRRFTITIAAALLLGSPLLAADKPAKPTLTFQMQPINQVIVDLKEAIRLSTGPMDGEAAVKRFLAALQEVLGEKGFQGLDLNRPIAGYVTVREKFEDSTPVLVAPYSTEKEFLDLLDRLKLKAEAVAGKPGIYKLTPPEQTTFDHDSYLRFADGWAYLGFNGDEVLDPANLVPIAELIDRQERAAFVVRLHPERFPEKLLRDSLNDFETTVNDLKGFFLPGQNNDLEKSLNAALEQALKLIRRAATTIQKDAKEATLRYSINPLTGDETIELTIAPKPGSQLAKDIAALKATPNRFAGMIGSFLDATGKPSAALGVTGRIPATIPEAKSIAVSFSKVFAAISNEQLPEALRPIAAEVFGGLGRTAEKGDVDFTAALLGPDKAGRFTVVGAIAFDDPAAIDKLLRDGTKDALLRKVMKLDADKAGTLPIHTLSVGEFLDPDAQTVFGKDAVVALAVGKDVLYLSFGPPTEAIAALKRAATFTPSPDAPIRALPGSYLETVGNTARLAKLVAVVEDDDEAKRFAEQMGADDKLVRLGAITATGGDKLTLRYTDNVKYLFHSLFGSPSR